MKNAINICMMIVGSIFMLTCSEAPELNVNPPVPGPTTGPKLKLTDEERIAVLKEISDMVKTMGDLKVDAVQQILAAWLKLRPEFSDAGAGDGNVWASFHDGRVIIIVPNWIGAGENTGGRSADDVIGGRFGDKQNDARIEGLPASNNVMLFDGLGKAFQDDRPFIKSLFGRSHTKYIVYSEEASIENLKAVRDVGLFYIFTHGGTAYVKPEPSNDSRFALWTTDTVSLANEQTYLPELNSSFLYYMNAVEDDTTKSEWHYAITSAFVRHSSYMNFAADAFFYIDGCNGMSGNASEFRTSMINEAANDKGTYIGWTAPTSSAASFPTHRFLFDRLLGTHDQTVPMEEPEQRPFDWPSIFNDMRSFPGLNLGVSVHGGILDYFAINTTPPILTPSIKYIWMADYESIMVIHGLFGAQPADGKVKVDGIEASIKAWTPTMIMAEIPTKGKGSHGDVVVSVRGNESNKVPLSEWTIPMNVSLDELGVTTEVILNLKIRADVHKYRTKPGEAPRMIRKDSLEMLAHPERYGWTFNSTSTGTYSVGGQRQVTCTIEDCIVKDTETVLNKSGNLPYDPRGTGLHFVAFYKWAEDMKTIYVQLRATIPNIGSEWEFYGKCKDKEEVISNQSISKTVEVAIPTEGIKQLEIKLDDNFKVQSGNVSKTTPIEWGRCSTSAQVITAASWSSAAPESPPKDDTDARSNNDSGN